MNKLGVSTWLWTSPFTTETIALFPKIRRFGFDFVEIPIEDPRLIDGKKVAVALADNGLSAVACGAWGSTRDLASDDRALQENSFEYIKRALELTAVLNARFLAGPMYSSVGKARQAPPAQRESEWQRAVENIRIAAEWAAAHQLKLAIEPINRFETDMVNTTADVVKMIDQIGHPAVGAMIDSFHMSLEERDLEQAIRAVGPRLLHVQVSENYRGIPGSGQTRWDSFARGLKAANYHDGISIESFTTDNKELAGAVCFWRPMAASAEVFAEQGLAFLRQLFDSA
jgi:D-psicose/D-tagatose/L-ribulose 3-epimerase